MVILLNLVLKTWKGRNNNYSEGNKSVCMVAINAMHYKLSFMISKLCFPTTLCDSP